MIDAIQWLGYGSFLIQGPPLIYINPLRVVRTTFHADVILIGHHHHEHFSPGDVQKLRGPDTRVVTNERVALELTGATVLRPWQVLSADRAGIKALPAYTPDGGAFPRADGGLGFVVSINLHDIYYAGATRVIPEMQHLHPDIAILPISGKGMLTMDEAVEVVAKLRPRWAIPSHYGGESITETQITARIFEREAGKYTQVKILPLAR